MRQLFVDFRKAYDSVRREVWYNVFIEFGIPLKLARLTKMCLHETYSRVCVDKHFPYRFPIQNDLNQGNALLSLLSNSALKYAIRRIQAKQMGVKLNGTHQLLVYGDDLNLLGWRMLTIKKTQKL